jgi:predicted protein tyrosine phosphatase
MTTEPVENVLFVCSRNQWRSPTAEWLFRNDPDIAVRSAGTSPRARRTVTLSDISWADVILVMEPKHKSRLVAEFRHEIGHTPIHVLDIPDDYRYQDPELIELLAVIVPPLIGRSAD